MSELTNDEFVAIIPARYGSTRFPGKPLVDILGVPLIVRVYERVMSALLPSQVFVATDDERIQKVCEKKGIGVVWTSKTCLTGTDRVWEAARSLGAEWVINVQGDEPLINREDILTVIEAKCEYPHHVINAMCPIYDREAIESSTVPKVVVNEKKRLIYMSRAPIPFVQSSRVAPVYHRQVCIYAFSRKELEVFSGLGKKSRLEEPEDIEILRFLDLDIPVHMVEVSEASVAVDVPKDVETVEALLSDKT